MLCSKLSPMESGTTCRPNRGTAEQSPLLFSLQHDKEDLKRIVVITELDFLFFATASLFFRFSRLRTRIKMGVGRRDLCTSLVVCWWTTLSSSCRQALCARSNHGSRRVRQQTEPRTLQKKCMKSCELLCWLQVFL